MSFEFKLNVNKDVSISNKKIDKKATEIEKDYIKAIDNKEGIQPVKEKEKESKKVIRLIDQPWNNNSNNKTEPIVSSSKEDDDARKAILNEIGEGGEEDSGRVIIVDDASLKDVPLLLRNRVPGTESIMNEKDKLRHELSFRPVELSVDDEAYETMPIEEFGKAMLRGMGWDDSIKEKEVKLPNARPERLGLGAAPKLFDKKEKKAKIGDKKALPAVFDVGSHVGITMGEYKGWIATLVQVRNVPGLEKVLVRLENWEEGCEVSISKSACELISSTDAYKRFTDNYKKTSEHPFKPESNKKKNERDREKEKEKDRKHDKRESESRERERERERERHRDKDRDEGKDSKRSDKKDDRGESKKRGRDEREEEGGQGNSKRMNSAKEIEKEKASSDVVQNWISPQIRVRIVSKKREYLEPYYKEKAIVSEVHEPGYGELLLPDGSRLERVREAYLETALPKAGGEVLIVSGKYRMARGVLIERKSEQEKAVIRLHEDDDIITISMDLVAEFVGRDSWM